jgi:hypothetical protein
LVHHRWRVELFIAHLHIHPLWTSYFSLFLATVVQRIPGTYLSHVEGYAQGCTCTRHVLSVPYMRRAAEPTLIRVPARQIPYPPPDTVRP